MSCGWFATNQPEMVVELSRRPAIHKLRQQKNIMQYKNPFTVRRHSAGGRLMVGAVALAGVALTSIASAQTASTTNRWVVAFQQTGSLPNNVDKLVAAAGGTI